MRRADSRRSKSVGAITGIIGIGITGIGVGTIAIGTATIIGAGATTGTVITGITATGADNDKKPGEDNLAGLLIEDDPVSRAGVYVPRKPSSS